jgi:hypothetical protein
MRRPGAASSQDEAGPLAPWRGGDDAPLRIGELEPVEPGHWQQAIRAGLHSGSAEQQLLEQLGLAGTQVAFELGQGFEQRLLQLFKLDGYAAMHRFQVVAHTALEL